MEAYPVASPTGLVITVVMAENGGIGGGGAHVMAPMYAIHPEAIKAAGTGGAPGAGAATGGKAD